MEERNQFTFYNSFYRSLRHLKPLDRVKVYDAICELALYGHDTELKDAAAAVFEVMRPIIENSNKKSEAGRIKTESNANQNGIKSESKRNQNGIKSESKPKQVKEQDKEQDKEQYVKEKKRKFDVPIIKTQSTVEDIENMKKLITEMKGETSA